MTHFQTHHKDRAIIEISGVDKAQFLQGIITQDARLLQSTPLIYSLLLTPQGRFQFELFLVDAKDTWLLDVENSCAQELYQRLQLFKLRSSVILNNKTTWHVGVSSTYLEQVNILCAKDPRHASLGFRFYSQKPIPYNDQSFENYHQLRFCLGVPEGSKDMIPLKSIPLEWNMDTLHAISWDKGCYMGQELTARSRYVGQIRKRIFPITLPAASIYQKNDVLLQNETEVGKLCSILGEKGLALISLEAVQKKLPITIHSREVQVS